MFFGFHSLSILSKERFKVPSKRFLSVSFLWSGKSKEKSRKISKNLFHQPTDSYPPSVLTFPTPFFNNSRPSISVHSPDRSWEDHCGSRILSLQRWFVELPLHHLIFRSRLLASYYLMFLIKICSPLWVNDPNPHHPCLLFHHSFFLLSSSGTNMSYLSLPGSSLFSFFFYLGFSPSSSPLLS